MDLLRFPPLTRLHQRLFTLAYRTHEAELQLIARLPEIVREIQPDWPKRAAIGLDVGAGTGPYARLLLDRCQNLVMIEPNHREASYLKRVFGERASVIAAAAGDVCGGAFLVDAEGRDHWRRPLARLAAAPIEGAWRQPCVVETIDAVASRLGLLEVEGAVIAKIDVEGHELPVLRGMSRLLDNRPALLVVEIEARLNPESDGVFAFLAAAGFACYVYQRGRLLPGSPQMVSPTGPAPGRFARLNGYRSNFVFLR